MLCGAADSGDLGAAERGGTARCRNFFPDRDTRRAQDGRAGLAMSVSGQQAHRLMRGCLVHSLVLHSRTRAGLRVARGQAFPTQGGEPCRQFPRGPGWVPHN